MSEFSESYHLFTPDQAKALELVRASGLRGFVLAPENGWTSFVVDEASFEPDARVTDRNTGYLVHYVNAEDHGWSFELFDGPTSVCRYRCDWENDVQPDLSDFQLPEISQRLGGDIAARIEGILPQLSPTTIEETFEHQTAYDFAKALALPHYEWFCFEGVSDSYESRDNRYAGCVEVPARRS